MLIACNTCPMGVAMLLGCITAAIAVIVALACGVRQMRRKRQGKESGDGV